MSADAWFDAVVDGPQIEGGLEVTEPSFGFEEVLVAERDILRRQVRVGGRQQVLAVEAFLSGNLGPVDDQAGSRNLIQRDLRSLGDQLVGHAPVAKDIDLEVARAVAERAGLADVRQIGRILQQNQRAAARFAIALEPDGCPAGFRLTVAGNAAFDDWAALSEGAYLLRSNIDDWSDQQLWKAYIQLTQAEAAFRIQKDQLNLRPIWHQREDRVQAHILVCFLAFVLWKSLEMWQSRAGLGNSPRTLLQELAAITSAPPSI